jgi:hypothetical protein
MTVIVGVVGAAVLFGLYTALRPSETRGCTGHCAGCTGDGACESRGEE